MTISILLLLLFILTCNIIFYVCLYTGYCLNVNENNCFLWLLNILLRYPHFLRKLRAVKKNYFLTKYYN